MPEYEIEQGIEIPPLSSRGRKYKYPWPEMEPGDSVFFSDKTSSQISGSCQSWGKRHGQKFVTRTVEGGVRVWRTE